MKARSPRLPAAHDAALHPARRRCGGNRARSPPASCGVPKSAATRRLGIDQEDGRRVVDGIAAVCGRRADDDGDAERLRQRRRWLAGSPVTPVNDGSKCATYCASTARRVAAGIDAHEHDRGPLARGQVGERPCARPRASRASSGRCPGSSRSRRRGKSSARAAAPARTDAPAWSTSANAGSGRGSCEQRRPFERRRGATRSASRSTRRRRLRGAREHDDRRRGRGSWPRIIPWPRAARARAG